MSTCQRDAIYHGLIFYRSQNTSSLRVKPTTVGSVARLLFGEKGRNVVEETCPDINTIIKQLLGHRHTHQIGNKQVDMDKTYCSKDQIGILRPL